MCFSEEKDKTEKHTCWKGWELLWSLSVDSSESSMRHSCSLPWKLASRISFRAFLPTSLPPAFRHTFHLCYCSFWLSLRPHPFSPEHTSPQCVPEVGGGAVSEEYSQEVHTHLLKEREENSLITQMQQAQKGYRNTFSKQLKPTHKWFCPLWG